MGSATTQALLQTGAALRQTADVDLTVASELFAAARVVGSSNHLSAALADNAAAPAARSKVIADIFGPSFGPTTTSLLTTVVAQRWSSSDDLVDGIEELAIRATAIADSADVEAELFGFSRTVAENPELELALGRRLGEISAKGSLVATLLDGRVSQGTALIVSSIVQLPRDRRIRQVLARAIKLVADQRGRSVATVISASPLSATQLDRLSSTLTARYGIPVSLNVVVDQSVVGGLRIEVGDDVIDASISSRLSDLRQRLAG